MFPPSCERFVFQKNREFTERDTDRMSALGTPKSSRFPPVDTRDEITTHRWRPSQAAPVDKPIVHLANWACSTLPRVER